MSKCEQDEWASLVQIPKTERVSEMIWPPSWSATIAAYTGLAGDGRPRPSFFPPTAGSPFWLEEVESPMRRHTWTVGQARSKFLEIAMIDIHFSWEQRGATDRLNAPACVKDEDRQCGPSVAGV